MANGNSEKMPKAVQTIFDKIEKALGKVDKPIKVEIVHGDTVYETVNQAFIEMAKKHYEKCEEENSVGEDAQAKDASAVEPAKEAVDESPGNGQSPVVESGSK